MKNLIKVISSDTILDQAYQWLCKRRKNLSHNNDVWELRRHWQQIKPVLQQTLIQGKYTFSPLVELRLPENTLDCWCAIDSLVLKAMTIALGSHLASVISPDCVHIEGHGGAKKAVRDVYHHLSPTCHVMKSDVKSYYASIDHMLLFGVLSLLVDDRYVLRLLWQYLKRSVSYGFRFICCFKGLRDRHYLLYQFLEIRLNYPRTFIAQNNIYLQYRHNVYFSLASM